MRQLIIIIILVAGLLVSSALLIGLNASVAEQDMRPSDRDQTDQRPRGQGQGRGRGEGGLRRRGDFRGGQPQRGEGRGRSGGRQPAGMGEFRTEVPAHPVDLILGRPTDHSVTLSVLAYEDIEGYVAYGTEKGNCSAETPRQSFRQGEPVEVLIDSLAPNARYYYQFRPRVTAAATFAGGPECTFHTSRPPGSTFTFTVTADPHLDENTTPELYRQTLLNALADGPDFHVDLGDTFMTGKHASRDEAAKQYLAQRYYFGLLAHSAPLFLALGNHDGEDGSRNDGTPDNVAVWSNLMRKRYFLNPIPDAFYSGNERPDRHAGLLEDYYAWQWGDALFVVLDPFWYNRPKSRGGDNWGRTLGEEQYHWLKQTLENSRARFKFVFVHHLVGGATREGRGGAEAARYFEWGGQSLDDSDDFRRERPGWPAPIHRLLMENGVSIVFHGHDHLFAKQDLDGIVYQEVPQPGLPRYNTPRTAAEYGYLDGVILGSPGHMRITVSESRLTADYVRSYLPEDETGDRKNREVSYSYTIP